MWLGQRPVRLSLRKHGPGNGSPMAPRCHWNSRGWPSQPPAEAGFPGFQPDTCLINRYAVGSGMGLHQDADERDFGQPIVSVSLGLPTAFLIGGAERRARPTPLPVRSGGRRGLRRPVAAVVPRRAAGEGGFRSALRRLPLQPDIPLREVTHGRTPSPGFRAASSTRTGGCGCGRIRSGARTGRRASTPCWRRAEFAVICPVQDGVVHLVEQFRYPRRAALLGIPHGDVGSGERMSNPRDLAAGELQEETGLRAGKLLEIGQLFQAAGYSNQAGRIFFATDLTQGEHALEQEEQDMVQGQFQLAEFERMIRDGIVRDAVTISAFAMARLRGLL